LFPGPGAKDKESTAAPTWCAAPLVSATTVVAAEPCMKARRVIFIGHSLLTTAEHFSLKKFLIIFVRTANSFVHKFSPGRTVSIECFKV